MKFLSFLSLICISTAAFAQSHCIVNEIHYAPLGGEPEWVELYNPTSQPVNLKNWKIRDLTATKKVITTKDAFVAAGGYIVLAKDTLIANYHFAIPAPVVALSLPSLNNDSDAVILYDAAGLVVDSLIYHSTWGGTGGSSLERIRFTEPSTNGTNWRTSRDPERSTPGRRNSVAPPPIDAAIDSVIAQSSGTNRFLLSAYIRNAGERNIDSLIVRFGIDNNVDSVIGPSELFHRESLGFLAAGKTIVVTTEVVGLIGSRRALVAVTTAGDGDTTNNNGAIVLTVSHQRNAVIINEIMYAPAAPEPEWIELQNRSSDTVDCSGWRITVGTSTGIIIVPPWMAPGAYLVVARDTGALAERHAGAASRFAYAALPTLTNNGAKIILKDDIGATIDSVVYHSTWGGASGASLERIDSSAASDDSTNWRESIDMTRSTCASRNTNARRSIDAGILRASLASDSTAVQLTVKNFGLRIASNIIVSVRIDSVHGDAGVLSETVLSLLPGNTSTTSIPIAGLPSGDNIITISAIVDGDEEPRNNYLQVRLHGTISTNAVTINEIMFSPRTGCTEYVELVNAGRNDLNLLGLRLSGKISATTHKADTMLIAALPAILAPGEYAVIAGDTTIVTKYANIPGAAKVFVLYKSSLGLGNDSDVVVITDPQGDVLDSVHYYSAWHSPNVQSTTGIALERINPRLPANNRTSWASSVAAIGGTPGATNSVFTLLDVASGKPVEPASASLDLAPNPFSPDGDGYEDLTIFRYSLPYQTATYTLRIFNTAGRLMRALVNVGRASHDGTVVWDGRDEEGIALPIGIYIAVLDAVDTASGAVVRAKSIVVVARKL